jgi:hypothetical protein
MCDRTGQYGGTNTAGDNTEHTACINTHDVLKIAACYDLCYVTHNYKAAELTIPFLLSAKPHSHVANVTQECRLQDVCWEFLVQKFGRYGEYKYHPSRFPPVHNCGWVAQ